MRYISGDIQTVVTVYMQGDRPRKSYMNNLGNFEGVCEPSWNAWLYIAWPRVLATWLVHVTKVQFNDEIKGLTNTPMV